MQAKAFRVARGNTPVAQMSFASQVPLAWQRKKVLLKFAWMADKTMCLAKETCLAKCIIRADWSPVGGLKHWLSPILDFGFRVSDFGFTIAD